MPDEKNIENNQCPDIENATINALPMIDQIAIQARTQAQRASALAMHEYRRKLQGIVLNLQDTVRDEGAKLAEQIKQAVMLQAEEKALDLVDDFINGRQAEAVNLSQNLLMAEEETEEAVLELEAAPMPAPVNELPVTEPRKKNEEAVAETKAPVAKQPQAEETSDDETADIEEPAKKPAFDFASFIARPQS